MDAHTSLVSATHPTILFDGVCNLCNGWVKFIIRNDKNARFRFSPLQSEFSLALLKEKSLPNGFLDSIVLVEGNELHFASTAALRTMKLLGGIYYPLFLFIIIPRFIREPAYRFIAKRRYAWFGKRETCMVPTKEQLSRFVE